MIQLRNWRKVTVALTGAVAVAFGSFSAANAFEDPDVIGPATSANSDFWSAVDKFFGKASSAVKETNKNTNKNNNSNKSNSDKNEVSAPKPNENLADNEFRSIRNPEKMGDFWQNLNSLREDSKQKPAKKYDRNRFEHWELIGTEATVDDWHEDIPRSCDARRATLIRDGHNLKVETKGCKIHVDRKADGGWTDPYGVVKMDSRKEAVVDADGNVVIEEYKSDYKPSGFDIDHIVALEDAWNAGADKWNDDKRQQFANDPLNLTISDASANRSKGSKTIAEYVPPGNFQCEYVKRYAAIKAKYDLTIKPEDGAIMNIYGQSCAL